jgi:hypothetical protein
VESLLRLGQVASQVQAMIGPLATELLDAATRSRGEDALVLDCDVLHAKPIHLVREMLVEAWRRQHWRRQAMGLAEWQQLAELAMRVSAERAVAMLPGAIRAERAGSALTLTRV